MSLQHLDDTNFTSTIATGTVLVDFSATWCGPCKMLTPIITQLAEEVSSVVVAKVDVDQSPLCSAQYDITSVPTMILFINGQEAKRIMGVRDLKALKEFIQ